MAQSNGFKIYGVKKLIASMRQQSLKGRTSMKLQVGYEAHYAIIQHENLMFHHTVGQAKYLEQPARQYLTAIQVIIARWLEGKKSMEIALTKAGEFLLEKSKELVPVDTGALRDSGFVKIEN